MEGNKNMSSGSLEVGRLCEAPASNKNQPCNIGKLKEKKNQSVKHRTRSRSSIIYPNSQILFPPLVSVVLFLNSCFTLCCLQLGFQLGNVPLSQTPMVIFPRFLNLFSTSLGRYMPPMTLPKGNL